MKGSTPTAWPVHIEAALRGRLDGAAARLAPASALAICHGGRVIAWEGRGEPRRDGAATTASTVFRIASMTKSFLAATALALRDEGLLDLHATADTYVPGVAAARYAGAPVRPTLEQLLSNRGGLTEDNAWGDEHLGSSRAEMSAHVTAGLEFSAPPGAIYQYSNLGISLIGRAIEAVTGRTVEQVIRERILDPLGLGQTRFAASEYPELAPLAAGFRTFDDGATFIPEPYVGSGALACIGSLFSTVSDIAVWMDFLGDAWADDEHGASILSAASRRELQSAHTPMSIGAQPEGDRVLDAVGYGYGLVIERDRRFGRLVHHSGGLPGFASNMRWHPTTGIGVVAFGNSDAFAASRVTRETLADVLSQLDAPAERVRPWAQTVAAARVLDDVVTSGQELTAARGILTRNVLRDVPLDARRQRLDAQHHEVGHPLADLPPFEARIISAPDASSLRWRIPCERGTLICDVHLVGLHDPLVQEFALAIAADDGRKPRGESAQVTDHHLPTLD